MVAAGTWSERINGREKSFDAYRAAQHVLAFSQTPDDAQACGQRMVQRMTLPSACKLARLVAHHLLLWTRAAVCRKPPLLRARFSMAAFTQMRNE
jgi:hypothetical protein